MSKFGMFSSEDTEYVLSLPYHLAQAGRSDELIYLLIDFEFIEHKILQERLQELINDYDLRDEPNILLTIKYRRTLEAFQRAIQLSSHIVEKNIFKLAAQLLGRLPAGMLEKQQLLDQISYRYTQPWLRPLLPTLISSDSPLQRTFVGHERTVTAVAVLLDGQRAISAAVDGTIRIWELRTGKLVAILTAQFRGTDDSALGKSPIGIAVTPNSKWAVSISRGDQLINLKLWNLETFQVEDAFDVSLGTNLTVAITQDAKQVITVQPGYIHTWKRDSRSSDYVCTANHHLSHHFAMMPDGKHIVTATEDNSLKVWDLQLPALLFTCKGHQGTITALTITPNGQKIVSGSADGTLKVWDSTVGQVLQTIEGCVGEITALATTPDSKAIISASETSGFSGSCVFQVWDLETGFELSRFEDPTNRTTAIAALPNCQQIICASTDNTLKLWNITTETKDSAFRSHKSWIRDIVITPSEHYAVSIALDGICKVWSLQTGAERLTLVSRFGEFNQVLITPDNKKLISASGENVLQIWNLENGEIERTLTDHSRSILAVTSDSRYIFSTKGNAINVMDLQSGTVCHTFTEHTTEAFAAILEPSSQRVFSFSRDTIKVWDWKRKQTLYSFNKDNQAILAVIVIANKQKIITASSDNTIEIRSLLRWNEPIILKGSTTWVRAVAVTPDGRFAICASQSIIEVWDLVAAAKLHTLHGHSDVRKIAVTPNGKRFISVSDVQGSLKIWDLPSGRIIDDFAGDTNLWTASITSDGQTIIAAEFSGQIHFLKLEGMDKFKN